MDLSTQIVPAIVILAANFLSGRHGSLRWETVTAIFGWSAVLGFISFFVLSYSVPDSKASDFALQTAAFCVLTALARDYEKVLRPLFPWNRG